MLIVQQLRVDALLAALFGAALLMMSLRIVEVLARRAVARADARALAGARVHGAHPRAEGVRRL